MIRFRSPRENIFHSPQGFALVIPVNAVGVAGAGLAAQAAQVSSAWHAQYKDACRWGYLRQAGDVVVHYPIQHDHPVWFSVATKTHWNMLSCLEDVRVALKNLSRAAWNVKKSLWRDEEFVGLAVPALGCGLGGLSWTDFRPLAEEYLGKLPVEVWLYPPRRITQSGAFVPAAPNPHYRCSVCGKDLWDRYRRLRNSRAPAVFIVHGTVYCQKCYLDCA